MEGGVIFEVMISGKTTMWQLGEYLVCVEYLYRVTLITHLRQTVVLMREDAAATAVKKDCCCDSCQREDTAKTTVIIKGSCASLVMKNERAVTAVRGE